MMTSSGQLLFRALLTLLAFYYAGVFAGADLMHNHEFDSEFHDNCPACHLQMVNNETCLDDDGIVELITDPLEPLGSSTYLGESIIPALELRLSGFSRAPPITPV